MHRSSLTTTLLLCLTTKGNMRSRPTECTLLRNCGLSARHLTAGLQVCGTSWWIYIITSLIIGHVTVVVSV